ncbi:MAG: hypothetical protein MRZ79_21465 [Bacteroidia bacterium]|nr:hypothetical protein [Bacteroidia bacterium]
MKNIIHILLCLSLILGQGISLLNAQGNTIDFGTDSNTENEEDDLNPQGPSNSPFEYLNQVKSDYPFESNNGILNLYRNIYRDVNPKSGYFYYLPSAYSLNWDAQTGKYDVEFNQDASAGGGKVVVTARLKPNITRRDIEIARALLELDVKSDPVSSQYPVNKLLAMPVAVEVSFPQVQNYGVDPSSIIVQAPKDFLDPITISFPIDRPDFLMTALFSNIGLNGTLKLSPEGSDIPAKDIPITLKLDDPSTFGTIELNGSAWRRDGWRNPSDYPLVLKNLHVLRMKKTGNIVKPFIYTWQMGNAEIPEKALAKIDARLFPGFLDNDKSVKKVWIEYSVNPCKSCNRLVQKKIMKALGDDRAKEVVLTTLSPLRFVKAEMMKIELRSRQADPTGTTKIDLPHKMIRSDGFSGALGTVFLDPGIRADIEYKLTFYLPDGTVYRSDHWARTDNLEIVIGDKQVKELIPELGE